MTIVCETERLMIRHLNVNDTAFIVQLLNDKYFIRYIADKKVRTHADAIDYLTNGPILSYQVYGFGLNVVLLKGTDTPIGICGLLKRDELDYPDLGYAFLPEFWGQGYAAEAANSVLKEGIITHSLSIVLAVTLIENLSSNSLLNKIGFHLTETIDLYGAQNNMYEYRA
ncbi:MULTISPECIES: GNAT family N-acetyltransferase [Shewanella]|uniref:GNAT family N-acetyltransferase n=1 Tax=unclassified Shewanella TaxID=196818 RepID=UPI0010C150D1|nr:GNAT family N-acetyltransferase [Shewanella sp. MEBiC00475]